MSNARKARTQLSIDDIIAEAKPLTRTAHVCTRGDLQAEYDEAEHDLREAQRTARAANSGIPDPTLGAVGAEEAAVSEVQARLDAIRDEMREFTRPFRFRAMKGNAPAYLAMEKRFRTGPEPERNTEGEVVTDPAGEPILTLDIDGFAPALLAACAVEPKMNQDQAKRLIKALDNDSSLTTLLTACATACLGRVDVPFSRDDSRRPTASTPGKVSRALEIIRSPQPSGSDESLSPEPPTPTPKAPPEESLG